MQRLVAHATEDPSQKPTYKLVRKAAKQGATQSSQPEPLAISADEDSVKQMLEQKLPKIDKKDKRYNVINTLKTKK